MLVFKIWKNGYKITHTAKEIGIVLTPDEISDRAVIAAWSYAVKYAPKKFEEIDYAAAMKTMAKRHPSWQCIMTRPVDVWYQEKFADMDTLDT